MGDTECTNLIVAAKWHTVFDESGKPVEKVHDKEYLSILGDVDVADTDGNHWIGLIHPDDKERVLALSSEIHGRRAGGLSYDSEFRMMTKLDYRWFHMSAQCTRRPDGSLERVDGFLFDVQDVKDYQAHQRYDDLRKEVMDYIVKNDEDPIELLKAFAEKIRVLFDCDQVIYRDLEKTRIMVNSPAIEDTWSVPEDYCRQCLHFDAHHPMYAGGYTEMDNCQEGWQGIPVYHKCPIKSSLTRIVHCNEEVAGYLAIHYVQKYHHFTNFERKTIEEFVDNLSLVLSRYVAKKESSRLQEEQRERNAKMMAALTENNQRVMALEDNFESLYDVELDSGRYVGYVKGDFYQNNVADKLLPPGDYFEDLRANIDAVIYPDDRDGLFDVLSRDSLRSALAKTDRIEHYYRMFVGGIPIWFKIRVVYKDLHKKSVIIGCFKADEEMAVRLQNEKAAKRNEEIIESFSRQYSAAYYGNLEDDTFRILARRDAILRIIGETDGICDAIRKFAERNVHPSDLDLFKNNLYTIEAIKARVPVEESFSFEYRSNTYGEYRWFRAIIRRINEDAILVGFNDCNDEVIGRMVNDRLLDEYDALYLLDLDKNEIQSARQSRVTKVGVFEGSIPYDKLALKFADVVHPDYRNDWLKFSDVSYVKKYLSKADHREYIYELPGTKQVLRRLSFDVLGRNDGDASIVLMSFAGIDDLTAKAMMLQKSVAEQNIFTSYFLQPYTTAYYVDLDSLESTVYKNALDPSTEGSHITDFFAKMHDKVDSVVSFDDRVKLKEFFTPENIRAQMTNGDVQTYHFRENLYGQESIVRMEIVAGADESHVAIGFKDVTDEVHSEQKLVQERIEMEKLRLKEQELMHSEFRASAVAFLSENEGDITSFLDFYAEKLRLLVGCDQVIYKDENGTRYIKNAPELGNDYEIAEQTCLNCPHSNMHSPLYAKGVTEMEDTAIGVDGVPVHKCCPVKSALTRTVSLDGRVTGYLAIHYILDYHHFSDYERKTLEEFSNLLSMSLSRYAARVRAASLEQEIAQNYARLFALADDFESLYDVEMESGQYISFVKGDFYQSNVIDKLVQPTDYFEDLRANIDAVIYFEDRDGLYHTLTREAIRKELEEKDHFDYYYRVNTESGPIWFRMRVVYKDAQKTNVIIGVFNAANDVESKQIAEQKEQLEIQHQQLEEALGMAQAANQAKTIFLNSMSHDIRTPMNAIIGYTSMAKKNVGRKDNVLDYLDKIGKAGSTLLELINQVLDMARIESGHVVLSDDPSDVVARAHEMVEIVGSSAYAKDIELSLRLGDIADRLVYADAGRMNQLIMNLLGNAVKYTPEGGRIIYSIDQLPCDRPGYGTYRFTVEDNGIGMSKEYLETIFEPFSRELTTTTSKIQGTGLGMSIVKKLVDLMGGGIDIQSELGKGTKITVTLTFRLQKAVCDSVDDNAWEMDARILKGKRVLLVEDNEMNREIATLILEEFGLVVETAEDGHIAIDKMKAIADRKDWRYYDFVLMDVQMPIMDGYEATKAIREIPFPADIHIPVIAMTANAFAEDRQNALDAGMDDHVAKPIDVDKLWQTMAKFI